MTKEEAEKYAKTMTYRDAVYNLTQAKCIPYRRATLIKVYELLDILDKIREEIVDTGAYEQEVNGKTEFLEGISYCLDVIDKHKEEREE